MVSGKTASDIGEKEGICYLFGYPILHSMSPLLHNTVYQTLGLPRTQISLQSKDIEDLLPRTKDPKFFGASVTMPHKIDIIQHLDVVSNEVKEVGACNTIYVRDVDGRRELCGTNTDVFGIREAFLRNVSDTSVIMNRPGMVIGGGGAARSAVYALQRWFGCETVYMVNRDSCEIEALVTQHAGSGGRGNLVHVSDPEQVASLEAPGPIVACIPDISPVSPEEIAVRDIIQKMLDKSRKGAILEMCYHPSPWTQIAEISKRSGWQVVLGTEAMIWQGLEQDGYWTGLSLDELPVKDVKATIDRALTKALH